MRERTLHVILGVAILLVLAVGGMIADPARSVHFVLYTFVGAGMAFMLLIIIMGMVEESRIGKTSPRRRNR